MKIKEVINLVIETAESGMPSAGVEILRSLNNALIAGGDANDDFFPLFNENAETLVAMAQKIAFDKEGLRKSNQLNRQPIVIEDNGDSTA